MGLSKLDLSKIYIQYYGLSSDAFVFHFGDQRHNPIFIQWDHEARMDRKYLVEHFVGRQVRALCHQWGPVDELIAHELTLGTATGIEFGWVVVKWDETPNRPQRTPRAEVAVI